MPRDLFIAGVMGGGYLLPSNYPSLAVVNRSFNDTMCQPRVILFRGMTAWTSGAKAEARKWYQLQAMLAALAAQHLNPAEAAEAA